ncbi:helix-turn-helix transcriptional regulator [Paenarthrobacter sp. Z7-10]|uniref:PadR family transcriptional regulator n=1 Tax=Paenarthrobacter sp. Z7-10 TaxID=2787635 RepID=UPI0022A8D6B4|nr:helix-turn-helix transcriptional regulator [Paenarthrobacter sp. Z7-10]MCZ2402121.1 helix-turn-helix transcriptional regulator [Paenarthrobacter sp. Z7-10]
MPALTQLTPLGVASLALLAERPMHPYEMYQLLMARSEDRLLKVRPGTLYHAVGRLSEHGLVDAVGTDREGNRPERTTYEISQAGRRALTSRLEDMLAVPANEYPEFPLAIAEAHNLPRGQVLELLDRRLEALVVRLLDLEHGERVVTGRRIEKKYWIDLCYQQTLLRADIGWIRSFQEDLRTGRIGWESP